MKVIISIAILAMYFLPVQTEAKAPFNSDFCDKIFSSSFFMEVSGDFTECKNRFTFLTNSIKRQLPQYD